MRDSTGDAGLDRDPGRADPRWTDDVVIALDVHLPVAGTTTATHGTSKTLAPVRYDRNNSTGIARPYCATTLAQYSEQFEVLAGLL